MIIPKGNVKSEVQVGWLTVDQLGITFAKKEWQKNSQSKDSWKTENILVEKKPTRTF